MASDLRSPWARKAVAIGAVLLGANLVLAAVGPSLPEPVTYPTREIQLAVERLDERTADTCMDVLVTGNSVAAEALSAQRLAQAWGLQTGVVSVLPGSIGVVDADWMRRVTVPRADPGTVVYVASPLMFVPEEIADLFGLGIYQRSVETRGGWPGDLQRWAVDHLPLVRYRQVLADPEAMTDAALGDLPSEYDEIIGVLGWEIEPDGHIRSTGTWSYDPAFFEALDDARSLVGDGWRIDQEQVDALQDEFRRLVDEGRRVVVVIPPVTDDLEAAYPGGSAGFQEYAARARTLAEEAGAIALDFSQDDFDDTLFRDTHHLNQDGSDRLTADVAEALGDTALPRCTEVGASQG